MSKSTNENCVDEEKVVRKSPNKKGVTNQKETCSYIYIVECGDGSLYTGWTNHLEERMKHHNDGKGAKYTRSRLPVRLVHYEEFATKQDAMKREYAIKQLTRKDKLLLVERQPLEVTKRCEQVAQLIMVQMNDRRDDASEDVDERG